MSENVIGFDLGATKTRVGLIQKSVIVDSFRFSTSSQVSKEQISDPTIRVAVPVSAALIILDSQLNGSVILPEN